MRAVVESAVGAEEVERGVGAVTSRFEPLGLLEQRERLGPGGAGRLGDAPSVVASSFCSGDFCGGGVHLFPTRFGATPELGQDPLRFHRGVEDVQAVFQLSRRRVVTPRWGDVRDGLRDPFGRVGNGDFQDRERLQPILPGLGLTIGRILTEDGRHTRRLDPD